MKKFVSYSLYSASLFCLCLTSCKQQNSESATCSDKTLTSAQQIFAKNQSDFPKTKSASCQDITRPLPANLSPIWDKAIESNNGSTTYVTIPISTATKYMAVFPCIEESQSHITDHNHGITNVIQKLVVFKTDDSSGCHIINIIPFSECQLNSSQINYGFEANSGMAHFSGFVAYHTLKGIMVRIEIFNSGTKQNTLFPDNENVGLATKYARLYVDEAQQMETKAGVDIPFDPYDKQALCDICRKRCGLPYSYSAQYNILIQIQLTLHNKHQANYSAHCMTHRSLKNDCIYLHQANTCSNCSSNPCICQPSSQSCHLCNGPACQEYSDQTNLSDAVHRQFLLETLGRGYIPYTELHRMQVVHREIDRNRRSQEDLHRHNLQDPYENYEVANKRLRDFFMDCCFFGMYADATHPILDTYLTVAERQEMLGFYAYYSMNPIVARMPSMDDKKNTFLSIFNSIKAVSIEGSNSDMSPEEEMAYKAPFGAIYDRWASGQRF